MRDRKAERAMLKEVYLRNLIAKYRDLTAKHYKVETTPDVGIFWMSSSGKAFHKESISLRDAVPYGAFNTYDCSHYERWSVAIRANPEWQEMEYEEIPRGRVVHSMKPQASGFIVYLPKILSRYESKIAQAFKLPLEYTIFDYTDEHYRIYEPIPV